MATEPVLDWTTDYDIFDPGYVDDPVPVWDDLREHVPRRPHRPLGRLVAADPLRRCRRDRPRRRALLLARDHGLPPRARVATTSKAPPITSRPARAHLGPPTDPPGVLRPSGREVRALHPRAVPFARSTVSSTRARPTPPEDYAQQIPVRVIAEHARRPDEPCPTRSPSGSAASSSSASQDPELRVKSRHELSSTFFTRADRGPQGEPQRRPDQRAARRRGRRPARPRRPHPRHLRTCCSSPASTRRGARIGSSLWHLATHPDDRQRLVARARAHPDRRRGAAARVLARDDGAHRDRGRRDAAAPDAGRRPGAHELPGGQPRPGGVPRRRQGDHRPASEPPHRLRRRHPPLRRVEPRPHGDAGRDRGVAGAHPGVRARGRAEVTWAGGQVRGPRQLPVVFP